MFFSTEEIEVFLNIILSFYSHENHFYVDNSEKLFNYFNLFILKAEICCFAISAVHQQGELQHRLPASCFSLWLLNTAPVFAGGTAAPLNR